MPAYSFCILVSSFFYALMALGAKLAADYFCSFEIVFYRSLLGGIAVAALMKYEGIPFTTKVPLKHFCRCVAGISAFLFQVIALSYIPLSVSQTLEYCNPLFFALFLLTASLFSPNEKFEWPVAAAILVGFSGVLVILRPGGLEVSLIGAAFGLSGAFCTAAGSWFIRDLGKQNESVLRTVFYFMVLGTIVGAVGTLMTQGGFYIPNFTWEEIGPLLLLVFSGLFGLMIWTFSWAKGHSLLNAVFQFSGIIFGALMGWLYFKEAIDAPKIFGMFLVFCAGLFSTLYLRRKDHKSNPSHQNALLSKEQKAKESA